jgi:hypothetical protein
VSCVPEPNPDPVEMTSSTRQTMALSIVAGTSGLIQLGLSISDLALLIDQGKKVGNFIRAGQNDNDLFDVLDEDREAVLKRRGLVDARDMEKRWPMMNFIHQGVKVKGEIVQSLQFRSLTQESSHGRKRNDTQDGVDSFTWVMVAITSALDECLPSYYIQELLIQVFVEVLHRSDDVRLALRVHIKRNIESWRSFGCTREMAHSIKIQMRKSLSAGVSDQLPILAVPQLNEAETGDMKNMLVWLLNGEPIVFNAMSPITYSIAEAWKTVGLDLCTDGNPVRESQACVMYSAEIGDSWKRTSMSTSIPRGLHSHVLQISWPRNKPESMIDALGVGRALEGAMYKAWQYGKDAAVPLEWVGEADGPYENTREVFYSLQIPDDARVHRRYDPHIGMLADQGFPADTEKTHDALERILEGEPPDSSRWLLNHVAQDYLLRVDNLEVMREPQYNSVYFKYQALIFGFYYELLRKLLSFDFDLVETLAFFHGIWGIYSTTFLAMCTQLGRCLRRDERASRAHILYLLAAMYNGRRKIFNTSSTLPRLVGVLGPISLLTLPLIHTTDDPSKICKIAVVDLPIVDLSADNADGDLMASEGGGIGFESASEHYPTTTVVQPTSPTHEWTVHPYMSIALGGQNTSGVVMAARCGKRLVGWFNPLAADVSFLSSAYLTRSYSEEEVVAFEIQDEHWEAGKALQPDPDCPGFQFGVVRSHGSPSLRYAAAGFYAEKGEEVAIARSSSEFCGAFDRLQAQDRGIVIA